MENNYKLLLIIPVLMLALATYLLLSGERLLRHAPAPDTMTAPSKSLSTAQYNKRTADTLSDNLKSNRESAYPYFLLGAGLLVALIVLPKLSELSFSPTNGITLKVLQKEVKAALDEAKTTAKNIEIKTSQVILPDAQKSLMATPTDISHELTALNESTARLNAYADLLEKLIEKKGRP
ncbi:hypothetical protein I2I11_15540 [Pontibacter sp. 172403-2]|uniref:hypothetical protein n=1 Tax=Pontibacter rufus TaxID=2791028 RepID=UPI0018AFB4BB|nr:hypothetical protein [Pontibacter sp. 172403-2]MBF9254718.1 hypothetical protein [Pontibacter sp. 172403-2]